MRRAARVDATQTQIVSALRAAGAFVWIIGLPVDLLCGYNGKIFLFEVKTNSKKKLTKLQTDFFNDWTGGNLYRVESPDDALRLIGAIK